MPIVHNLSAIAPPPSRPEATSTKFVFLQRSPKLGVKLETPETCMADLWQWSKEFLNGVFDTALGAIKVKVVDGSAGGGGGTQYDAGEAPPVPKGTASFAKVIDPNNPPVYEEGDVQPVSIDSDGATIVSQRSLSQSTDSVEAILGASADTGLNTIDTAPERLSTNPLANTTGNAAVPYTPTGLLRWLVGLFQDLIGTASGSSDTGNPVKIGGVYRATKPTLADNQRSDLQLSNRGFTYVDFLDIVSTPNNINAADVASNSVVGQNNQNIITGNPTNNSTVSIEVSGSSSFAVLVTGTWVGTLQFERSLDNGVTWTSVGAFSAGTNFIGQQITANGAFHGNASSATHIRMRAIAWTSGVASVRILAGQGTGTITIGNPIRLFDAVSGVIATIKAALTPATPSDTAIVTTARDFGNLTEVAFTLTRPADTTAYNDRDAIANSTTQGSVVNPSFANAARANGGAGYITAAFCQVLGSTFNTPLRLHLFKAAPTAIADNAIYTTLDANNPNYIGHIDFSGFTTGGTGSTTARATGAFPTGSAMAFICAGGASTIFAMVETRGAFTPTASQTFRFQLAFDRY